MLTKSTAAAFAVAAMAFAVSPAAADDPPARYLVEAATVTYELTGMESGTKTVAWDQYGRRELTVSETTIAAGGMTIPKSLRTLILPDFIYQIDVAAGRATRMPNITTELAGGQSNMTDMGIDMIKAMGGQQTGTDTIAGRTCDVWTIASLGTTTCIWEGVPLSNTTTLAGMTMDSRAVEVVEGPVDESLFVLDPALTVVEMTMPTIPGR